MISCNKWLVRLAVGKDLHPCSQRLPFLSSPSSQGSSGPQQHEPVVLIVSGRVTQDSQREALHHRADPMGLLCLVIIYCCGWDFKQMLFG